MGRGDYQRTALGATQEKAARDYLEKRGYRIITTNYLIRGGEIDIIAMDGETLCFIEVRSKTNDTMGHPLETVSATKISRIIKAAKHYIMLEDPQCQIRFDVIGIVLNPYSITLVQNAFEAND